MDLKKWQSFVENEIQEFLNLTHGSRDDSIHLAAIAEIEELIDTLSRLKALAADHQNEEHANEILAWQLVLEGISHEMRMWIELKRGNANKAWSQSVSAETSYSLASKSYEGSIRVISNNLASRVEAIQQLVFPRPVFMSVGAIVRESRCSICDEIYGECDHIAGRAYMGQTAIRVVLDADLQEVSIVERPANKEARIMAVPTEEGMRDFMSWVLRKST